MKQQIALDATALDVAFLEDTMYISLDSVFGQSWIREFHKQDDGWREIQSDKWQVTNRKESPAEIYWLETMRKRIGQSEDE
jgi:hypothetical protein